MKAIFTTLVFLFSISSIVAQSQLGEWKEALIYLNDGTERQVEILLDEQIYEGVVICKIDSRLKTYTSYQLTHFVFNESGARKRSFYSIPYKSELDEKPRKLFLELLYNGEEISLLSQKYYVSEYAYEMLILFDMDNLQLYPYSRPTLLSPLTKNIERVQEDVLVGLFGNQQPDMHNFIADKHLKFNKKADLISMLEYYHEL